MAGEVIQQSVSSDINARLIDLEERQQILKDRISLIGRTLVDEREKTFLEIQDIKKLIIKLQGDMQSVKGLLQRTAERTDAMARKEELAILQRQFDMFREQKIKE